MGFITPSFTLFIKMFTAKSSYLLQLETNIYFIKRVSFKNSCFKNTYHKIEIDYLC